MSKIAEASAGIKRLAAMFKPIIDLDAALDELGSVEQSVKDLTAQRDALSNDIANFDEEFAKLKVEKEEAISRAEAAIGAAEDEARRVTDQAVKQGDAYLFAAQAEASKQNAEIEKQKDEFNAQFTRAQLDLAHKKAEADEQEARLKNINEQLAKIKEL